MVDPHEQDNSQDTEKAVGETDVGDDVPQADSEMTDQIGRLKTELNDAKDRYLRSQAELENFRRRIRRDMEDERKFATQTLLSDLLPVLDNVERAIEAASQGESGLLQGFQMVHHQLLEVLERHNCPRIPAVGETFDPTLHEAVAQEASSEYAKGVVVRVALDGYRLHDRIIRPAQVVVSNGPPEEA